MKNSLMKRYKPQMILFLIIVIEAVIMMGLVQYRSYIVKKQEALALQQSQNTTTESQPTDSVPEETQPLEEITTLANPQRDKNAADNAYANDDVRIVCLDPALGGYAKGNTSETESAMSESEYNLEFAQLIMQELNKQGVVVYMTRESNKYVSDTDRTDLANNAYADLMVTLNRDSYDGSDTKSGITAWVHHKRPKVSDKVATKILDALKEAGAKTQTVDAGTADSTTEDYATNEDCIGPSLVLGMGSVLNEKDITDYEENKEAYAQAVANAIVSWMEDQGL